MGGTKRLGLHKSASQEKVFTHMHIIYILLIINYSKQTHRGHCKNTEHNKHSHMHAPKQITHHQKNNVLQHDEKLKDSHPNNYKHWSEDFVHEKTKGSHLTQRAARC